MFTRFYINAKKEGKTWTKLTGLYFGRPYTKSFEAFISVESDLTGILYYGTSIKSMIKQKEAYYSLQLYHFLVTGLERHTKYHFYIKNTAEGEAARTGIYKIKTS